MTATDHYVGQVKFALRDLPWRQRRELVRELREHLAELPPDTDLFERLGMPEQYAADLRAAAGLERGRGLVAFLRARHPLTLVLAVVVLTLIGLTIGAVVWIDSYQPLAFGNLGRSPDGAHGIGGLSGEGVDFHKGRPFDLGIEIQNTGPFAVRVLGVPYPSFEPWSARLMMAETHPSGLAIGPLRRFRPFDLQPGQRRYLILKGVWACHSGASPGAALSLSDFPVRFSFLWRTTTAEIPLPDGDLAITFPKGCPSPKR